MAKKDPASSPETKAKDAKKATKAANKAKTKNTLKKAADKALLDLAADLPAGKGNFLVMKVHQLDKIGAEIAKLNLVKRGIRGELKEQKIDLGPLDEVLKLRKKDPEDQKAWKASVANYTDTLGMELSPEQKTLIEQLDKDREAQRKAMEEIGGGDSGREVGSGFKAPENGVIEDADPLGIVDPENQETESVTLDKPKVAATGIPARNETLTAGLKVVTPIVQNTTH